MTYISNKKFYEQSLKKYGISAKGVHWSSKFTQYKRFEIITEFLHKEIKSSSIIDAGCGLGEYFEYLRINNILPQEYIGVDCEQSMIKLAKQRFQDVKFVQKNILYEDLQVADYIICSGAMNTMNFDQCSLFIKRCYSSCKKAFVFNFLQLFSINGIAPYEILALCESVVKKDYNKISYKEGYLDNDFTICMVK